MGSGVRQGTASLRSLGQVKIAVADQGVEDFERAFAVPAADAATKANIVDRGGVGGLLDMLMSHWWSAGGVFRSHWPGGWASAAGTAPTPLAWPMKSKNSVCSPPARRSSTSSRSSPTPANRRSSPSSPRSAAVTAKARSKSSTPWSATANICRSLLSFLATQFRFALAAKEARLANAQAIQAHFSKQGVPMWRARAEQIQQTAAAFQPAHMRNAIKLIFQADRGLRDTRPDDRTIMEQFILRLTAKA